MKKIQKPLELKRLLPAGGLAFLFCSFISQAFSTSLAEAFDLESDLRFEMRHHALHKAGRESLRKSSGQLLLFLESRESPVGIDLEDYLSLKNDIFDKMFTDSIDLPSLVDVAQTNLNDPSSHPIWRDYCLQKYGLLLSHPEIGERLRTPLFNDLWRYMQGEETGMTGTALLAAIRAWEARGDWKGEDFAVTSKTVGESAMLCAREVNNPLMDRMTALQVASLLGYSEARDYSIELLQSSPASVPLMLRSSAVAALGIFADGRDADLVRRYRLSADIRLRAAAVTALYKIQQQSSAKN
ncbi:MAG: hypothetical protein AAF546_03350 [Verrucomicrobiota bacterium]